MTITISLALGGNVCFRKRLRARTITTQAPPSVPYEISSETVVQVMVRRIARFGAVGLFCLCFQLAVVKLIAPSLPLLVANAIGFVTSAQLNFTLSYLFTWSDSKRQTGWRLAVTWSGYCLVAVGAAFINAAAFAALHILLPAPIEIIVILSTIASTCCTFLLNQFFIFRPERNRHDKAGDGIVYARME